MGTPPTAGDGLRNKASRLWELRTYGQRSDWPVHPRDQLIAEIATGPTAAITLVRKAATGKHSRALVIQAWKWRGEHLYSSSPSIFIPARSLAALGLAVGHALDAELLAMAADAEAEQGEDSPLSEEIGDAPTIP